MEILITWHLRREVPRLKVLLFTRKESSSMKQADLKDMSEKTSKSVCISTIVVCPDRFSHTPTMSSAIQTP
jgi:hypothetical protein